MVVTCIESRLSVTSGLWRRRSIPRVGSRVWVTVGCTAEGDAGPPGCSSSLSFLNKDGAASGGSRTCGRGARDRAPSRRRCRLDSQVAGSVPPRTRTQHQSVLSFAADFALFQLLGADSATVEAPEIGLRPRVFTSPLACRRFPGRWVTVL